MNYQSDPPVADAVAYLRVHDLDSLEDGDTVSSWGGASRVGNPIYKNDATYNFPYVQLNEGYFNIGQHTIQPSLGFTFVGYVLTTSVGAEYPMIYSYAEGTNDGLRIYRTGGSGQHLVFRSQKAASIEARAEDATTTNTWQVITSRVTDNGDSTLTMEIFLDNVLQGSTTEASSDMSGIVSGLLEVGQSTAWRNQPVSPIYVSDMYFYDRALSDTELVDMHTYFSTLGDPYTPPHTPSSFVEGGVVMYVDANNEASFTPGSNFMNDLSGSSVVFDMDPGVSTSLNDGGLDFSAGTNYLKLSQALRVQTISLWYKKGISPAGKFIDMRDTNGGLETVANMNQSTIQGDFFLNGSIYVNGVLTSGEDYVNLADDVWYNVVFVGSYLTQPTRLTLFANLNLQYPYKLIFGSALFYDRALTEAEIAHNYSLYVPSDASITSANKFNATAGPVSLRMSWPAVSGATAYQVGFSLGLPGDNPVTKRAEILLSDAVSYTITNLSPETTYSLYLYYSMNDDEPSELLGTESFETLEDIATNYTTATFADDSGVIDLRKLDKNTLARIKTVLNEVLTTGTQIQLPGGGRGARAMKKAKFVKTGEAIAVEPDIKIAFAFEETDGAGQSATLNVSDNLTVDVSFDETTSGITIGGVAYNEGDTFVLDNQKVTVVEV